MRLCRASAGGTAGQRNSRTTYGTIPSGVSLTEELTRPCYGQRADPRVFHGPGREPVSERGHGVARPVADPVP